MMARLAEWRDDVSGTLATGGTSTAYTLASNQLFDNFADMNGAMMAFVPHATNGATVTLNVDGLGAKPLRSAPSVELPAGVLVQGTPYVATYNNSDAAWYLQGFMVNPYNVPIGSLMDFTGDTPPNSSFILPAGQAISRETYATYFGLSGVGIRYGAGDGSTTFNVPDLRGRVVAGLDNLNGSAANRITIAGGNFDGTVLGGTGGVQSSVVNKVNLAAFALNVTDPGHPHTFSGGNVGAAIGPNFTSGGAGHANVTENGPITIASATTGVTVASGGSGTPLPLLPPVITLTKLLRII
jgi:microcystin-dependent protein